MAKPENPGKPDQPGKPTEDEQPPTEQPVEDTTPEPEPVDPYAGIPLPMNGTLPKIIRKPTHTEDGTPRPENPGTPAAPGQHRPLPTNAKPARTTRPTNNKATPGKPTLTTETIEPRRPKPPQRDTRG